MGQFVITVAQQKGGAGKTTISAHLSVALAKEGYRVGVIDIDPQGSLTRWHSVREEVFGEGKTGLTFKNVNGWRVGTEIAEMKKYCDIILVDSPPHVETDARTAIRNADLVLVPLQPSPTDLWATKATYQLARSEQIPVHTILNRVNTNSRLFKQIRQEFAGMAVNILGNRVAYASSLMDGMSIQESAPRNIGALEIEALADTVLGYMPANVGTKPNNTIGLRVCESA